MKPSGNFSTWEEAVRWVREQPDRQDLVTAAYYDDPLASAAERYWRSEEWRGIRAFLPEARGNALDVGAGRGIASYALARDGFSVQAVEPDGSDLVGALAIRQLANISGLPIEVSQCGSEQLPFPDCTFSVVFARAVLHHTTDLVAACSEFYRVLKPGGVFIGVREHVISRQSDLPEFLRVHPLHSLYGGENAYLLKQYLQAIHSAGFGECTTLAPFDSAINYAPQSLESLRCELASRIAGSYPHVRDALQKILGTGTVWSATRVLLNLIDSRPGRLYSFVAYRS